MKKYYRIMLGKGGSKAEECYRDGYIGADFDIYQDLSNELTDDWRVFNKKFIPIFISARPEKTKVAAGLACGMLWSICKGLEVDDIVLSPNGNGEYLVGRVKGGYYYVEGADFQHRRRVEWFSVKVKREDMSAELKKSTGSIGTVANISPYAEEIEQLIKDNTPHTPSILSTSFDIEDPSEFAMEKHLEDFLVKNRQNTPIGKKYDIYEEDGEMVGQQYPSDTGPIDILAISKNHKELLVIELKKGRASDVVMGQIQRYMGYVQEELAEDGQTVKGVIIGLDCDVRLKRALSVSHNIEFYKYKIDFRLEK